MQFRTEPRKLPVVFKRRKVLRHPDRPSTGAWAQVSAALKHLVWCRAAGRRGPAISRSGDIDSDRMLNPTLNWQRAERNRKSCCAELLDLLRRMVGVRRAERVGWFPGKPKNSTRSFARPAEPAFHPAEAHGPASEGRDAAHACATVSRRISGGNTDGGVIPGAPAMSKLTIPLDTPTCHSRTIREQPSAPTRCWPSCGPTVKRASE